MLLGRPEQPSRLGVDLVGVGSTSVHSTCRHRRLANLLTLASGPLAVMCVAGVNSSYQEQQATYDRVRKLLDAT